MADGGTAIAGLGFIIVLFVVLVAIIVFFINKKEAPSPGPSTADTPGAGTPSGHGARSPAPVQAPAPSVPQGNEQTGLDTFLSMLGPLLLGIGVGLAPEIIISAIKRLTANSKTLIKNQLKALRAFKGATRPKFGARAAMRSTRKLLAKNLSKLGLAARVRLGMVWGKALKAAGWTTERITATLAKRLGADAAQQIATASATKVTARAASAATSIGPLGALDIAIAGVSLGLDLSNTGGWMTIDERQTSDLLKERAIAEADLKNSYIGGFKDDDGVVDPSTAVGFYPLYWGPLDEMGDTVNSDGLDVFDVMVEERMFEMLMADEPDPFIVKLLENVARQYGVSSTDVEQLISASMLTDMTQDDYWGLYDRAFDSICVDNGGVLIDTGITGRPKQCSHASETACHAQSPWAEGTGLVTSDDKDTTYTEWRDRDFFNKNYSPAQVPTGVAGACIIQDPTRHENCSSESICMKSGSGQQCGKNKYIRNRGVCQNTQDLCQKAGVSYCSTMRQPGGSGADCPTALDGRQADLGQYANILLPGETLPSCYKNVGDNWAEFFLGSTIYRYFESGAYAGDIAALLTASGTLPGGTVFTTSSVLGADQGLSALTDAQNLVAQGQAQQTYVQQAACTMNGGKYTGGKCYTCPAGQTLSAIETCSADECVITGYNCVTAPPPTPRAALPWEHAATPTPPGVQAASVPVQTSTVSGTQSCPSGSVNSGFGCINGYCGANTPCLTCPAGQTLSSDNAWCYTCPSDAPWTNSTNGCVKSSAPFTVTNAVYSEPTVTWPSGVPYWGVSTITCPTGSVKGDYYCYSCPTGQVSFIDSTGSTECRSCPTGYSLNSDQSYCLAPSCPANSVWDPIISDCKCSPGYTKSADGLSCVALSCSGRTQIQL